MLGLFSAKSEHPLASTKEAKRIAVEISQLPPEKAMGEASTWFESLTGIDDFAPLLRFERIVEIANASLPHARRQARAFVAGPRLTRLQEQQQWRLNHDYWLHLGNALERCLADASAQQHATRELHPQMAVLLTALLIAYGGQLRWQRLHYGLVPDALWGRLGEIYLRAVRENIADSEVQAFDAMEGISSIATEYFKILLLHVSAAHNLLPREIGLAERIAPRFLTQFSLRSEAGSGTMFWIDAGKPMPPRRLTQLPAPSPGLRFVSAGEALPELQQLRASVAAAREPPADLSLGGQYSRESILHVIDHLAVCWSPKPPTRKNQRHRVSSRINVIAGLPTLFTYLSGSGLGLDDVHAWQVEDISQGGISARLPLLRNDWIRVGALLGFQPENTPGWQIGIVRRFSRENEINGSAGIETVSKMPRALTVMNGGLQTDLILLDVLRDDSSLRIILAPSHWEDGATLLAFVDGRPWRLYADERLEEADDWIVGRFVAELISD